MAKARAAARGGLSRLPISALQAEIRRREAGLRRLHAKRQRLLANLERIEAEIRAHGISLNGVRAPGRASAAAGRRRPRNEQNLVQALAQVLKGKTMSVTEVARAVQAAGYKTTSPNFRTIVNQTLINSGKFKRVGRGQYTLK